MTKNPLELLRDGDLVSDLTKTLGRVNGELTRLETNLKSLNTTVLKTKHKPKTAVTGQKRQAKNDGSKNEQQSAVAGKLSSVVSFLIPLVQSAVEHEKMMAEVKRNTNIPTEGYKDLEKQSLKLFTEIPVSIKTLNDNIIAAGRSKVANTKDELLSFAKNAGKMEVAYNLPGGQAGKIMANWQSKMKLSQPEAVGRADLVGFLSKNLNASVPDIISVSDQQWDGAKDAGLAYHELAALSAAVLDAGVERDAATKGLREFIDALAKGTAATEEARGYWKKIGMIPENVASGMKADAAGTIKDVLTAILTRLPKNELPAATGHMFSGASKDVVMPLLRNMGTLEKSFSLSGDKSQYAGFMSKEFEVLNQTTANKLQLAENQLSVIGTVFGKVLLPSLNQFLDILAKVSLKLLEISTEYPKLTSTIVGGTVGLLAAGAAFSTLAGLASLSTGSVGKSYGILRKLSLLRFGRLGLAGIAIGGLILALNELGALKPLKEGFLSSFDSSAVKNGLKPGIETMKSQVKDLQDFLKTIGIEVDLESWEGLGKIFGKLATIRLTQIASDISTTIKVFDAVGKWIGNVSAAISLKDWEKLKELTTEPIKEKFESTLGVKVEDVAPIYVQSFSHWGPKPLETSQIHFDPQRMSIYVGSFSPYGPKPLETSQIHFDPQRMSIYVGSHSPWGPKPLETINNQSVGTWSDWIRSFKDWQSQMSDMLRGDDLSLMDAEEIQTAVMDASRGFDTLDNKAAMTTSKIISHFSGISLDIRDQITTCFQLIETEMSLLEFEIGQRASTIKSHFDGIAGSVGNIAQGMQAATKAARSTPNNVEKNKTGGAKVDGKPVDIPGLAGGGPMRSGRPYLVGENGPELIFPNRSGWVAHNRLTRNLLGGFLNSGVSGLFHFINPFRSVSFGGLAGGSISRSLIEALLRQITAPASNTSSGKGPGIGAIHFSPNITVSGNADPADIGKRVYQAAEQGVEFIRNQIEALWNDERRVDYGS